MLRDIAADPDILKPGYADVRHQVDPMQVHALGHEFALKPARKGFYCGAKP